LPALLLQVDGSRRGPAVKTDRERERERERERKRERERERERESKCQCNRAFTVKIVYYRAK
jgi:hypothetical protein